MDFGPATVIRAGWNPGLASGIDGSSGELTWRRDGRTPGICDVARDAEDADDPALGVAVRPLGGQVDPCHPRGLARLLAGQGDRLAHDPEVIVPDPARGLRVEQLGVVPAEDVLNRPTDPAGTGRVDQEIAARAVLGDDGVIDPCDDGAEHRMILVRGGLGPDLLGDVASLGQEELDPIPRVADGLDREVDGDDPGAREGGDVDLAADDLAGEGPTDGALEPLDALGVGPPPTGLSARSTDDVLASEPGAVQRGLVGL